LYKCQVVGLIVFFFMAGLVTIPRLPVHAQGAVTIRFVAEWRQGYDFARDAVIEINGAKVEDWVFTHSTDQTFQENIDTTISNTVAAYTIYDPNDDQQSRYYGYLYVNGNQVASSDDASQHTPVVYVIPPEQPPPPVCNEGDVKVLETCPDGSTWSHRQVCKNNAWHDEYQQCPTSPKPDIIITNLRISGSGDLRPAFITVSFTVKNGAGSTVNVDVKTQKDCNPLTGDCTILDDQQITLAAYDSRDFTKSFTETVTGQHTLVVSVFSLSGTILTSASQDYVVGPITPGNESVVIFIPDPFDPTTGKLQIQNPDGSINEIRVKKVQVEVTHTGRQSYQPSSTLKVYSYVPVPPVLCIAKVVSPIPLSLEDMVQTGFLTLSEDVIKEITGAAVPVSKIVTAAQIVQCLHGTEDKVEIVGNWQFEQAQTYYFAVDRNAKLEAEYQYIPMGTTSPVTETGQWQGTIDQSLHSIIVEVGETTSSQPSQPFSIGDLSLSADPTSIATSDSTTINVNYSIQTYLPIDLTITVEVWEDTHTFGILDKKLCSQFLSADANQAACSIRGTDLGSLWHTGNHDLFVRLIVNWHSLDNNEPMQTKKESQRITISVSGSLWPFRLRISALQVGNLLENDLGVFARD
jgi:hypothetical protein